MFRTTARNHSGVTGLLYLCGLVLVYVAFNQATQYFVSGTAELDQSEQLLLSQFFQLGYSAQPPLYTYLTRIIFWITGPALAPLLALKALVLALLAAALLGTGKQFGFDRRQQLVVLAGLVFIPQFIWESQRDLTHSVLTTCLAAATLLQAVRTQRSPVVMNYLLLGLVAGLGLISKYNYLMFFFALMAASLFTPQYRAVLLNPRIVLTALVAVLVAAPHFYWLMANPELASSSARKLQAVGGNPFKGLGQATLSALAFLTPLWLFSAFLVWRAGPRWSERQQQDRRLLMNLLLATVAVTAIFVLASGAQQVKDRWFQPLFFYLPLLIAFHVPASGTRLKWYLGLGAAFALLVAIALPLRVVMAETFGKFNRLNLPYPALIQAVKPHAATPDAIFAESRLLGGNARPIYPDSVIYVPEYRFEPPAKTGTALVLCTSENCDSEKFRNWLRLNFALDVSALKFTRAEMPYRHAPAQSLAIYWSEIQMPLPRAEPAN